MNMAGRGFGGKKSNLCKSSPFSEERPTNQTKSQPIIGAAAAVAQQLTELLQQQDGRRCLTTLLGTGVDPTDPCSIPACSTLSRRSTGSDFPLGWAAAGLAPTCGCQAGRQGGG